jgi:hypothetical protein
MAKSTPEHVAFDDKVHNLLEIWNLPASVCSLPQHVFDLYALHKLSVSDPLILLGSFPWSAYGRKRPP